MNNKPLYLLNWLANVGLTEHLESQAPGALDILQRSANDLIGIVNTLSKITDTEKSEGLEDFLNELKVTVTYLRPLMESSKADRLSAGSFYFDNLNGAHPVQSIEQVWSRNVSVATPPPTLDIPEVKQLVGGRPFDTGVHDMAALKKAMEKGTSEADAEKNQVEVEQMPAPPAEINLKEPASLAEAVEWKDGCDLTISRGNQAVTYINGLLKKSLADAPAIVRIELVGNRYQGYTRNPKTRELEPCSKTGKIELRNMMANGAPKADATLLAKVGRHIQSAVEAGNKISIATHFIGAGYVYVIVTDEVKKVDFTYFTTKEKLAAYFPSTATI